jgi:hypothetical protein
LKEEKFGPINVSFSFYFSVYFLFAIIQISKQKIPSLTKYWGGGVFALPTQVMPMGFFQIINYINEPTNSRSKAKIHSRMHISHTSSLRFGISNSRSQCMGISWRSKCHCHRNLHYCRQDSSYLYHGYCHTNVSCGYRISIAVPMSLPPQKCVCLQLCYYQF